MKIYDLNTGDRFKLAGDTNSPVFIFDRLDIYMSSKCHDERGEVFTFAGYTPVIKQEEEND